MPRSHMNSNGGHRKTTSTAMTSVLCLACSLIPLGLIPFHGMAEGTRSQTALGYVGIFVGGLSVLLGLVALWRGTAGTPATRWTAGAGTILGVCGMAISWIPIHYRAADLRLAEWRRQQCAKTLEHIGHAIKAYANENAGQFPPRFSLLYERGYITMQELVCPNSKQGITTAEIPACFNVLGHPKASYIYLGGMLDSTIHDNRILVYEKLDDHENGINVLYDDGHVAWFDRKTALVLIAGLPPCTLPARGMERRNGTGTHVDNAK